MTYQIRHAQFGIFEGEMLGMCFWYPDHDLSEPHEEFGLCRFQSDAEAQEFIDFLESDECSSPDTYRGKMSIEPYNEALNQQMVDKMHLEAKIDRARQLGAVIHA